MGPTPIFELDRKVVLTINYDHDPEDERFSSIFKLLISGINLREWTVHTDRESKYGHVVWGSSV
jgi:hypothetical protein